MWKKRPITEIAELAQKRPHGNETICVDLEHVSPYTGQLLGGLAVSGDEVSKLRFNRDDVLFAKLRPYLKKAWLSDREGICSSEFWVFKAKKDFGDPAFIQQFVLSESFLQACAASSGSKMPRADWSYVETIKFPLPPLAEQRKIAEILRTWDEAIETAEAELKAKQERKRGLMDKLIDGGSAHLAPGSGRTKYRLKEIASMASGGTPKTSVPQYFGGNIPWVSISDMTAGSSYIYESKTYITEEGLSNSSARIFNKGTVLFAMYASIGECRIAGLDLTTSQAILGIIPKPTIRSEYLYYYLCRIKESAKSHGQTGTQANLNKGIVGDFEIPLPSLGEQDQILEILKAADSEIENSAKLADSLRSQKRGLMQKLLTGEVRVAA